MIEKQKAIDMLINAMQLLGINALKCDWEIVIELTKHHALKNLATLVEYYHLHETLETIFANDIDKRFDANETVSDIGIQCNGWTMFEKVPTDAFNFAYMIDFRYKPHESDPQLDIQFIVGEGWIKFDVKPKTIVKIDPHKKTDPEKYAGYTTLIELEKKITDYYINNKIIDFSRDSLRIIHHIDQIREENHRITLNGSSIVARGTPHGGVIVNRNADEDRYNLPDTEPTCLWCDKDIGIEHAAQFFYGCRIDYDTYLRLKRTSYDPDSWFYHHNDFIPFHGYGTDLYYLRDNSTIADASLQHSTIIEQTFLDAETPKLSKLLSEVLEKEHITPLKDSTGWIICLFHMK